MNKKVYIRQDGTIPGHRIIEELKRRGGVNEYEVYGLVPNMYYHINNNKYEGCSEESIIEATSCPDNFTQLLYNKEDDTFYEKSQRMTAGEAKEAILQDCCVMTEGEYTIPKGFEAVVEGDKVIIRKWQPNIGDMVWYASFNNITLKYEILEYEWYENYKLDLRDFPTAEECQAFCDKLNAVIEPIFEERRKEIEK